jgi:hypothetical protein
MENKNTDGLDHITTKKEYMEMRLKLENNMLLFFGYSNEDMNEDEINEWFEFLKELKTKFTKNLQIKLVNKLY